MEKKFYTSLIYEIDYQRLKKGKYFLNKSNFKQHMNIKDVNFLDVPLFDEFKPDNIVEHFQLKKNA